MPSYVVRVLDFKCVDESGPDIFGSDEVFWIFTAASAGGQLNTDHSRKFGNVDSGNTEAFAPNSIVWPGKGSRGADGPIGLSVQLWESDQGSPEEIERKTRAAFGAIGQVPGIGDFVRLVPPIVRDNVANLIEDDLMGSKTLMYPARRLERRLRNVGSKFTETHRFGGRSGDLPFEIAGGPDYDLRIEVERTA